LPERDYPCNSFLLWAFRSGSLPPSSGLFYWFAPLLTRITAPRSLLPAGASLAFFPQGIFFENPPPSATFVFSPSRGQIPNSPYGLPVTFPVLVPLLSSYTSFFLPPLCRLCGAFNQKKQVFFSRFRQLRLSLLFLFSRGGDPTSPVAGKAPSQLASLKFQM